MRKWWVFAGVAAMLASVAACGYAPRDAASPVSHAGPIRMVRTVQARIRSAAPIRETPIAIDALSQRRAVVLTVHGTTLRTMTTRDAGHRWTAGGRLPNANQMQFPHLDFINPHDGFAWDNLGVWSTTDGGAHWSLQARSNFSSLVFTSPSEGLAVANGHVVATTNGGRQWTTVLDPKGVNMLDLSHAGHALWYAAGVSASGPLLYGSHDGGHHWSIVLSGLTSTRIASAFRHYAQATNLNGAFRPKFRSNNIVTFTSPRTGWLELFSGGALATVLFHTADGGASWSYAWGNVGCAMGCNAMGGGLYPAAYYGSSTVWRFNRDYLQRSVNAGSSWTSSNPMPFGQAASQQTRQIQFINAQDGWLVSISAVYRTVDGGMHWTRAWPLMPQTAASAAFVHGYGWVVTSAEPGTLWETSDGGRSWQIGSKHFQHITAFKLWAPERGWIASSDGSFWITPNGGHTWHATQIPGRFRTGPDQADSIEFINPRQGWLSTYQGLWQTTNGGHAWHKVFTLLPGPYAGDFLSSHVGLALNGAKRGPVKSWTMTVMETNNGGRTWTSVGTIPMLDVPSSIYFATPDQGWVLDRQGLLSTADAGRTWTLIRFKQPLQSLTGHGRTLVVVTETGRLLQSRDGGRRWTELTP